MWKVSSLVSKMSPLLIITLVSLPGCFGKKNNQAKKELLSQVDIPVAGDGVKSFFDQDLLDEIALESGSMGARPVDPAHDYAWVDDVTPSEGFKAVYFDFDGAAIKPSQRENVEYDREQARKVLSKKEAAPATIIIEGHACHSAGSAAYNLALSEKRAKIIAENLTTTGVPAESLKVVGRGQEVPALINGKPCTGSREQQWANRRVEVHVINA